MKHTHYKQHNKQANYNMLMLSFYSITVELVYFSLWELALNTSLY